MIYWCFNRIKNFIKSNRVVFILVILLASATLYQGYKYCKDKIYLYNSDTIVCVDFNAIRYLFHKPYEYYAVNDKSACRIPEKMIIDYFGEEVTQQKIQNTSRYNFWGIYLYYSGGRNYNFQDNNTLKTSLGDQYKIVYNYYGFEKNKSITSEEQHKIIEITEELCREKIGKEPLGEELNILEYSLIHDNNTWYIITKSTPTEKTLIRINDKGRLIKVLEISEGFFYGGSLYFYEH